MLSSHWGKQKQNNFLQYLHYYRYPCRSPLCSCPNFWSSQVKYCSWQGLLTVATQLPGVVS